MVQAELPDTKSHKGQQQAQMQAHGKQPQTLRRTGVNNAQAFGLQHQGHGNGG